MAEDVPVAIRQLTSLAKYASRVPALIDASKTIAPGLALREVTAALAPSFDIPERDLHNIFVALENIRLTADNAGSVDKAIDRLLTYYGQQQLAAVESNRDAIQAAVRMFSANHPAALSLKARKLTYMHENLLSDVEIITDARPVYDEEGEKVVEFIITHSLVVTYQCHGETKRSLVTMDASDVQKLQAQCARAIRKATTLKNDLGDRARIVVTTDGI